MPALKCKKCGYVTNTTTSKYNPYLLDLRKKYIQGEAEKCYARWDGQKKKWIKGCAYDEAKEFTKSFVDSLIEKKKSELDI